MKNTKTFRLPVKGFTLIELMVAMVISLFLLGGMIFLFINNKDTYNVQNSLARIQENARFALQQTTQLLHTAGYIGDNYQSWNTTASIDASATITAIANECYNDLNSRWAVPMLPVGTSLISDTFPAKITAQNNSNSFYAGCIPAADYLAGTDVLSMHLTGPLAITDANMKGGGLYVRSDLNNAIVFRCSADGCGPPADDPTSGSTAATYQVRASVYYIRPYSKTVGDGIPTLMRTYLTAQGTITSEPLVEGVAHMQIQLGIDSDADGIVDRYVDASDGSLGDFRTPDNMNKWDKVKTVRIWLLLRSIELEANYTPAQASYTMGDQNVNTVMGFRYRMFTTTITLRNPGDVPIS